MVALDGTVTTVAGSGLAGDSDGTGTAASFNFPRGLALDYSGNLYVADSINNKIRKITLQGSIPSTCGVDALCLVGGRFKVTVEWLSPTSSGRGQPVSLTPNAGYFWFFDSSNVEVVVKVLDGCVVNGRKWVFVAGLTNLKVVVTVTDTLTGLSKTYANPQGVAFLPILDTDAFPTCP